MDKAPDSSVQSVQKAISILKAFSIQEPELGVNELSRRVGLHKSTVSRLLSTLEHAALVERNPVTDKFCLGVGLIPLAGLVISHADVRRAARAPLRWLAETTEETINLAVLDGEQVINVEQIPSSRLVKNIGWVGRRSPLHCTSTGKVLLAHMPEGKVDSVLAGPLTSFTPSTITDPIRLREELTKIRDGGFAVGHEELEEGLNAVAAPVRDYEGRVVAAVSVSGPSYRVSPDRFPALSGLAKEAANRIASQLGYAARQP
ncbi:MAG: IclR family transcriptional regulator [Chloroflexi bacterium]|nr:IclR family transcriptional regulator [Chloroflexota bacterium]